MKRDVDTTQRDIRAGNIQRTTLHSFKSTADTRHHHFFSLNRCSLTTLQDQSKMIDYNLQLLYFSHIKSRHVIQTLVTDRTNKPNTL